MQQSIRRHQLLSWIARGLQDYPIVALLGSRQVGKTTLARDFAASQKEAVTTYDLERPADVAALSANPAQILSAHEGLVIIDEVQRLPDLFTLLRPIADSPTRRARFLLLGSASWDLVRGVSESLAGRIHFIDVGGFSLQELGPGTQKELWLRGGFPRAYLAKDEDQWVRWMDNFSRTFLERDIPALGSRVAPRSLNRFWNMLAHFHGQTWNAAQLARSMDVSPTAVNHYRDLLAGTFMLRVLPPWFENLGKRLIKSPKVYFRDSGILHHFLGIKDHHSLHTHPRYGASWEGFALEQTLLAHGQRDAYFYATQRGAEVDLFLLRNGQRWGFEFKCTDAPKTTKSMHTTSDDLNLDHLWIVYPGDHTFPLTEKITALPLTEIDSLAQ
jgi:predicted AAA+ superfamily ATPase